MEPAISTSSPFLAFDVQKHMSTDHENEQPYNEWKELPMKHFSLRRVLSLALCLCLAVTLLSAFSPTRSAHAATTKATTCQTRPYAPGDFLLEAGQGVQWTTCAGNTMLLLLRNDGDFALYLNGLHGQSPIWETNTAGYGDAGWVRFQSDSNLVVYNYFSGASAPVWSSKTNGKKATNFELQSDGNMVIYGAPGTPPLWASGTSGH
jgi:hypothetical protein